MAASGGLGRVYGGSSGAVMIQNHRVSSSSPPPPPPHAASQPLESFFISGSSSSFLGSSSMVSFEDVCGRKRSAGENPFFRTYDQDYDNVGDQDYEDYFHQPEKKRRLTIEQVRFLEKSFETENKLEPERKVQLAKDLGLQPRQVAIWFQNRRARWKTKQLEKDFDVLQASFNTLKDDYDCLLKEKELLQAQVVELTEKLHLKQKNEGGRSELPNTDRELNSTEQQDGILESGSVKSDVVDSDSTQYYGDGGGYSSFGEAFEADHSDISQDEQDYLSKTLLPSCNFDIPGEEHHASLLWPDWDINLKM